MTNETENTLQWFKRGDGVLFCAAPETATFQMMTSSGEFTPLADEKGNEFETDSEESLVEQTGKTGNSGQGGSAKRRGAGRTDKGKTN